MVERILRRKPSAAGEKPHVTCWFNAWMHDNAPNLGSAFAAEVAQAANLTRSPWRRFRAPLPNALRPASKRRWVLPCLVVIDLSLLCLCLAEYFFLPLWVQTVAVAAAIAPAIAPLAMSIQDLRVITPFAQAIWSFVSDPKRAASTASMDEVRKELHELIQEGTPEGSRFVIFVDDLERCRPPRVVEVLEAVNQLVGHERVVTVIIGDIPAMAACADIKYRELAPRYAPAGEGRADKLGLSYGRAYLQKIIQLQFDLPAQTTDRIKALTQDLLEASAKPHTRQSAPRAVLPRNVEHTRSIIVKEIEARLPVAGRDFASIERAVTASLGSSLEAALAEDLVRERIQRRLSNDSEVMMEAEAEVMTYVEPLPRHAKRILNRLRLLIYIAHEREMFGGEPNLSPRHIGKWAVLCERWPELAQALCVQPEMMARLEQDSQYEGAVNEVVPFYGNDVVLRNFCLSGERLAIVINRIVHFTAAVAKAPVNRSGN